MAYLDTALFNTIDSIIIGLKSKREILLLNGVQQEVPLLNRINE